MVHPGEAYFYFIQIIMCYPLHIRTRGKYRKIRHWTPIQCRFVSLYVPFPSFRRTPESRKSRTWIPDQVRDDKKKSGSESGTGCKEMKYA
jgi:hypothetical protein